MACDRIMKNRQHIFFYFFIILILSIPISCTPISITYSITFDNRSSYNLTITPNGQSWLGFYLPAHTTHVLTLYEKQCYFYYNYASYVNCYTIWEGSVVFTNK